MKRRTIIKAIPAVATGTLIADAATASIGQSPFAIALAQWDAVQAQCKPICDRHTDAEAAHMTHRRKTTLLAPLSVAGSLSATEALARLNAEDLTPFKKMQVHSHGVMVDLRVFDHDEAQDKIKRLHDELRVNFAGFVNHAALDKSEATTLELMDLIVEQEKVLHPIISEFEAAEIDWNQWLDDEEQAFIALCRAPAMSNIETVQKKAAIRESTFADHIVRDEWFEALLSSIN